MINVNMETKDGVILNTNGKYCEDYIQITPSNADAISAQNIKEGVTILGVTGTLEPSNIDQLISGKITTLNIPDNVTKIRENAFYKCSNLSNITIPNSVTSIGENVFSGCSSLASLTLPFYNPSMFGTNSYNNSTNCNDYYIPNSLESITLTNSKTIENELFKGHSMLKNVTLNDGITSIGDSAFSNCTGLTSIIIPNSVTNIGNAAFWNCTGLTSITIPNSVTSINSNTFEGCSNLSNITIPNSVTSIGESVFYDCSSLTNITIPNSVTNINGFAFFKCSNLTSITIPDSVTSIGRNVFDNCTSLTSINIPNSVTNIGQYIFKYCSNLTNVTIENGFNVNGLNLSVSTKYTHDTILSWLNALYDRTGLDAYKLIIGTTNLNKLTDEEKAIATNKNWTLA